MTEQKNEEYKSELPSRAELHGRKNKNRKKTEEKNETQKKRKISIPFVLVIILLLMPVVVMIYANKDKISIAKTTSGHSGEEILFEEASDTTIHSVVSDESSEKKTNQEDEEDQKEKSGNTEEKNEPKDKETDKSEQQSKEKVKKDENKQDEEIKNKENKETSPPKKEPEKEKQESTQDQPPVQNEGGEVYHTVQPGETLFRIAMNYYQSQEGIEKIRQANGLSGNEISVGQKLRIPQS
ncbi:LysM peptidoglycan-binding domain-containing protein [Lederbergia galactosidilytica]|uniref:LysM domain-containing protein n=1 Tax=Lederbergia galactosidilytica TaxID=217031 RepID=A0A178AA16_9BACI|nr:LysM peptidoglycan-binding domain-containing protein [Lederbergia galactosidilytica]OAK75818.1 hypothetical protein ABB05_00360 [Lederbergia galactosidilytica]